MFQGGDETSAIAGVVDRPRLFRILDSPLVRVCVVQGPSGCEKTTLLRSWALQHETEPVTWVSLSGGLLSRSAFWEHVAGSASRLGDLSEETAAEIKDRLSRAVDPVRIAIDVLADAGPVVLVFDAYEHMGDAMRQIDEDLARLLTEVPELRIVVTTRAPTRLSELEFAGDDAGIARLITLGELALTPDEVGALIRLQTGIDDPQLAASIVRATRGFALSVRAAVLTLAQLGRVPRIDSAEWGEVVAARLESLLPSPEAVRFVTDTSVPPYVDVELGRALTGAEDPRTLFNMLERNGFGRWIPYAQSRQVFQYVETVRDTFLARAASDEERYRRSCVITAAWLLENEEVVEQALHYAIEGGDYALADRVFVSLVIVNPAAYISDRFLPTLREVPEEVLDDYPMLAFGLALALLSNPSFRSSGPRIAEIAARSTAVPSYIEPTVDAFSISAMQAIAARLALRFRDSCEASLAVVRSLGAMPPELGPSFGEHIGTILRQLSFSLFQGGRIDEALATIDRSIALLRTQTTRDFSTVYAAGFSAFAGDITRARTMSAMIDREAWPAELRRSYMNGPGLIAEGYDCLDALDPAGALEVLHDAESYMPMAEFWSLLAGISVAARHGLGQSAAEAHRIRQRLAEEPMPPPGIGDNVATERLHAMIAIALLDSGDRRSAEEVLALAPEDSTFAAFARIAAMLDARLDRESLSLTRRLLELPGHTIRTRAEVQTMGAVAAMRLGLSEQAWTWLSGAAVAWETHGPRAHVAMLAPRDRRLLWEFGATMESTSLQRYLEVPVSEARTSQGAQVELTRRERVVLAALAEHDRIRDIAESLVVSPHTVKSQLQSIYRKLGVSSRGAALAVARELGLLDRTPPSA
ncbi:MAG: hypothetical protein D3X82_12205 [Candidatus Leucobacter sulfamidivorax]|nr:hypothetical protein [Candidatus Leucobacter sulfamidivorax]